MHISEFDFDLPEELIAQEPPAERGGSRLMVLGRDTGMVEDTIFATLPDHFRAGDLVVLNDTRVFPARLLGRRAPSGGAVECLLLSEIPGPKSQAPNPNEATWEALVHPGQKLKPGARVVFEGEGATVHAEILERRFFGRRAVRLWTEDQPLAAAVDRIGHIPLPPYIKRADRPSDHDRYQTVFAAARGSIAAPTAGLHFTPGILDRLTAHGVETTAVTLHVGYGTFKPVRVDDIKQHEVDAERFSVPPAAASALTRARREGRRIIAVGTTTVRTLESLTMTDDGEVAAASGATRLFIRPGHRFQLVTGMVTNFHLPRSSLLMLVAALAGREPVLAAYRHAIARRYRFYSYGDAMLII